MNGKQHRSEQIIQKLRAAEAMLATDKTIGQVVAAVRGRRFTRAGSRGAHSE